MIKVRATFGTAPFTIDGFISLRGNKVSLDDTGEIILDGDFVIDTNHSDGKVHIILQ